MKRINTEGTLRKVDDSTADSTRKEEWWFSGALNAVPDRGRKKYASAEGDSNVTAS